MSSFPISITWQVQTPPTTSFDQLAKSAQSLDQSLAASSQKFDDFGQTVTKLESPLGAVGGSMGELSGNMGELEGTLDGTSSGMEDLAGATEDLEGSIDGVASGVEDAAGSMDDLGSGAEDAAGGMEDLASGAEDTGGALEDMSGSLESTTTGLEDTNSALEETVPALEETTTGLEDTNTALEETVPALEETTTGLEDTNTALEETVPALEDTNTALEDTVPALEDTASALEDTVPAAEDTATAFEDAVPAIEDTSTALEDTVPAVEDTNTALGDMGTAIEEDVAATDDFTGALSGMNDANAGVTGGLTENNTLMGNLATSTDTTAGSTENLKGSFGRVALGMAGAAGAGVALFNMWDAVGDAQVAVDAANIRLERSQTMVDKALLAMTRTLAKLNGDMSLGVSGLGEYNAAFRAFNGLIESGVTSGAQYDAALVRLQTAFRGLSSDTAEGQRLITQLGIQMDTASQKVGLLGVASNNAANALEAKNEAMTNLAFNTVPTAIAGIGSLSTTISDIPKSAHTAKLALLAVSGALSSTLVPALLAAKAGMIAMGAAIAPIAIPIGIVVGAIGLFVAAVTAIRANIKVFDDLGVAIGNVFPQLRPLLDDTRQAFINLSDGINSAISVILGGIDSFSGGMTDLQAQWDGFTGTLAKGTGEISTTGAAMGQLAHIIGATGEQVNIGKGKWEDMNGTLVAFSGKVKVAAGGWHELGDGTAVYSKSALMATDATTSLATSTDQATTAMDAFGATGQSTGVILKEQSANYSELTNAQKLSVEASNSVIESLSSEAEERYKAFLEADKYLRIIEGITPAAGMSMAAITGMAQGLREEAGAHAEAVTEAAAYIATKDLQFLMVKRTDEEILKYAATLEEEEKALGKATDATAKHVEELTKLKQAHTDAAAEIAFYADATNLANRMQLEYQAGIDNANLKLIDQQAALANTAGELQRNFELLDEGILQEIAYAEGVQEAAKALQDKILALEKMKGAYDATNAMMKEGTLIAVEFATGIQETKTAVQQSTLEVVNLAGELEAYSDAATRSAADNAALMRGFLEQKKAVSDLYEQFAEATGAVEALRMQLADTQAAQLRFNTGLAEGRKSALEFMTGMMEAKGEAAGFRSEMLDAAGRVTGAMTEMGRKSTEELQQLIEVANRVPGAFAKVVQGIDAMGQKIVDRLSDAAKEGSDAFRDEIDALEDELRTKFSKEIVQELRLQAEVETATRAVETALGVFASMLRDKPLEVALETQAAQDAMSILMQHVDQAAAMSPKFQPLQAALNSLAAWSPGDGIAKLPVLLTQVLQGAQGLEGGMQGVIQQFDGMFSAAAQSAEGLAALQQAFTNVGLTLDTTTGKVTDASGKMVADLQVLGEGATNSALTTTTAMDTLGPAGTAARTTLGYELVALEFLMDKMAQEVKQSAIEVSTAFSNMAANTGTSMNTLASGIIIMLAAFAKIGSGSQQMATTVSGSFSNMASNTRASMNTMASGIIIIIASFTKMGTDAQRGTTTVSTAFTTMGSRVTSATNTARTAITTLISSITTLAASGSKVSSFASTFSSAMSKVQSSASSATSAVKSLQSAINSLKSKTITLTTIRRTVYQTAYAARGGAFVASSPTQVGPLKVSEFGQQELVTVTPLQNPSGQTITGPGMQVSTSGPGAKAFAKSGDKSISLGGPMNEGGGNNNLNAKKFIADIVALLEQKGAATKKTSQKQTLIREQPIIINMDGREIVNLVNRRIFEISDSIIS